MTRTSTAGESIDGVHLMAAGAWAAVAYFVGLAATAALLLVTVDGGERFGAGAVFYGAHNVDVGRGIFTLNGLDRLTNEYDSMVVLWALPPLLLAFAGNRFAATRLGRSLGDDPIDGTKAGALVAAGYLVLAVGGTFVFTEVNGPPDLADTLWFMGVAYPVVFGGIGGYLSR